MTKSTYISGRFLRSRKKQGHLLEEASLIESGQQLTKLSFRITSGPLIT